MFLRLTIAAAFMAMSCSAYSAVSVMTWNVKQVGGTKGQQPELIAAVASQTDILVLQEVGRESAAFELRDRIQEHTGVGWSVLVSHPARNTYTDLHAFIYRDSKVRHEDRAVVYFDPSRQFSREPFSAAFTDKEEGSTFVLSSMRVVHSRSERQRVNEVDALHGYWEWLRVVYGGVPRILAGDFNLALSHPAWDRLRKAALPLVQKEATTLPRRPGEQGELMDNIWVEPGARDVQSVRVMSYPEMIGLSLEEARTTISEHLPVIMVFGRLDAKEASPIIPLGLNPFAGDSVLD